MTQNAPSRKAKLAAWSVLMRQTEYLANLVDELRYNDKNPEAAKAVREKVSDIRAVADWLREDDEG